MTTISIPALSFSLLLHPESSIYGRFELFVLSIADFSKKAISNLICLLIVLDTFFDPLSNDGKNSFLFHQKYVLNKQNLKLPF